MITKKLLYILAIPIFTSGCATSVWEAKYGREKPQISFVMPENNIKDRIYVWNPNTTAAYIKETGEFCISTADVYKTRNTEFDVALKAGAINEISNLDASTKLKLLEQVTKLSEKDAAGTFLSVALFNICMISSNQKLTSKQTEELITNAINKAAEVANGKGDPKPVEDTSTTTSSP